MKSKILALLIPFIFALGCATHNNTANSESRGTQIRVPASAQNDAQCWEKVKSNLNDLAKLGSEYASCRDSVGEYYDLKTDKAKNSVQVRIQFIRYGGYDNASEPSEIYSNYVSLQEIREYFNATRRNIKPETIPVGNGNTLVKTGDLFFLKTAAGESIELASPEKYFEQRASECLKNSYYGDECESGMTFSAHLNWVVNDLFSTSYFVGMYGAKSELEVRQVRKWNGKTFEASRGVTDLVPEASLLTAMRNDWLIRNSNVYDAAVKSTSITQFLNKLPKAQYSDDARTFLSYSIRLPAEKRKIAVACARAYDDTKSKPDQRGMACLKKNKIILYDYNISANSFSSEFEILMMSPTQVRVAIPFSWASATEHLRFDVPLNQKTYVHYVPQDKLRPEEQKQYSVNRCAVGFGTGVLFIEASQPQLLTPANECL